LQFEKFNKNKPNHLVKKNNWQIVKADRVKHNNSFYGQQIYTGYFNITSEIHTREHLGYHNGLRYLGIV